MTTSQSPGIAAPTEPRSAPLAAVGPALALTVAVGLAYGLPFYGWLASFVIPLVAHDRRRVLWPDTRERTSRRATLLAWAGLWAPALVTLFVPVPEGSGEGGWVEASTVWLVLPLCGPGSSAAIVLPALAAAGVALGGLLGSAATRRVWPWVLAAWLAPWAHHLVFAGLEPTFVC